MPTTYCNWLCQEVKIYLKWIFHFKFGFLMTRVTLLYLHQLSPQFLWRKFPNKKTNSPSMERNFYSILIVPLFIQWQELQGLDAKATVCKMLHKHKRWVVLALMNSKLMTPPNPWEEIETQRSCGWYKGLEWIIGKIGIGRFSSPTQHYFKSINAGLQSPSTVNARH